jgi:methylenetetrahydrofolate dehydrogenase (NADP+)/methenyltetrahydrofolate cyclohydrolase/formyltetrahydrofolate synthetase
MAILALANNLSDMRERMGKIVVASDRKRKAVTCNLKGAMMGVLKRRGD